MSRMFRVNRATRAAAIDLFTRAQVAGFEFLGSDQEAAYERFCDGLETDADILSLIEINGNAAHQAAEHLESRGLPVWPEEATT